MKRLKRTEVQEIINSLKPKKSPEQDPITGKILKKTAHYWNAVS
jgi:hypothetical protein